MRSILFLLLQLLTSFSTGAHAHQSGWKCVNPFNLSDMVNSLSLEEPEGMWQFHEAGPFPLHIIYFEVAEYSNVSYYEPVRRSQWAFTNNLELFLTPHSLLEYY